MTHFCVCGSPIFVGTLELCDECRAKQNTCSTMGCNNNSGQGAFCAECSNKHLERKIGEIVKEVERRNTL